MTKIKSGSIGSIRWTLISDDDVRSRFRVSIIGGRPILLSVYAFRRYIGIAMNWKGR